MCILHTLKYKGEAALIDIFLNAMEEETKPNCIQSLNTKLHIISNGTLLACLLTYLLALLRDLDFSLSLSPFKASLQRCLLYCIMRTHYFNTHFYYYTTVISSVNPDLPGITTGTLIRVIAVGWALKALAPGYYIVSHCDLLVQHHGWNSGM